MPATVRASVVVPARDSAGTLARTLAALLAQEPAAGHEVIVVDDGSTDATPRIAAEAGEQVTLLRQQRLGPAAARNLGAAHARAPVLAFCDADVYPTPGWLEAGLDAIANADVVQGRVLPDPSSPLGPFDRTIWVTGLTGLWETANLFVRREAFDAVGGFEDWLVPEFGKALAEDVWFGWRCHRAGARVAFCEDALAHHAVFPRGWREYAGERRRLRHFPAMAAKMPELRGTLLHRRVFLNRRTMRFDAGVAGLAAALALRSPWPLVAALPYARRVAEHAHRFAAEGPGWPAVAAADVLADCLGFESLVLGSVRNRAAVL